MSYQRDHPERVRIGVVGLGSHSYRTILPALTYLPVDLIAVCDQNPDRVAQVARQYGVPHAFTDAEQMFHAGGIDAVLLCVSGTAHPDLVQAAFAAGLHVWLEKPAAVTPAAAEAMLAARGDRICVVGYKKAFMPATRKAVELLALPETGALRSILGTYPMSIPEAEQDVPVSSKWLVDGCHPLALLLELGGPVVAVTTHRGRAGGGALILEFDSGAIGNLHLAEGAPGFQPTERYCAYADGCTVTIDNTVTVSYQRGIPFRYSTGDTFAPVGTDSGAIVWQAQHTMNTLENKSEFLQGIYGELRHFLDATLDHTPATTGTLETAVAIAHIVEAALDSDGDRRETRSLTTAD